MIVRIFKTNQIYIFAFIPLVLLILRWPTLLQEPPFTPSGQLPFLTDFFSWLSFYPWLSLLLSMAAISIQSYWLAIMCDEHRLMPFSSYLPAMVLALNYSVFAPQSWFSPVILANVFLVFTLRRILNIFHLGDINALLFRIGIYISLASLLYLPALLMLLTLYYDLSIIRRFKWREYVIPVVGLFTPYVYLLTYYYMRGEAEIFFNYFIEPKTFLNFLEWKFVHWIPGIVAALVTVISVLFLFSTGQKRTVRENNLFKVIGVTLLLSSSMSLVNSSDLMSSTTLIWPSLAIIWCYYILSLNRKWWGEFMVYCLIISILFRDLLMLEIV